MSCQNSVRVSVYIFFQVGYDVLVKICGSKKDLDTITKSILEV